MGNVGYGTICTRWLDTVSTLVVDRPGSVHGYLRLFMSFVVDWLRKCLLGRGKVMLTDSVLNGERRILGDRSTGLLVSRLMCSIE